MIQFNRPTREDALIAKALEQRAHELKVNGYLLRRSGYPLFRFLLR